MVQFILTLICRHWGTRQRQRPITGYYRELLMLSSNADSPAASFTSLLEHMVLSAELVSPWVLLSFILQHGYSIVYFRAILQDSHTIHVISKYSKISVFECFFCFLQFTWNVNNLKRISCLFVKTVKEGHKS